MVHFHNGHLHLPHLHIYRHLRRFIKHLTRHVEHIILYITALLIPPLAVYLRRGVDKRDFALNVALTLLGWYVNPAGVSYYVLKLYVFGNVVCCCCCCFAFGVATAVFSLDLWSMGSRFYLVTSPTREKIRRTGGTAISVVASFYIES
jgi:uncharacterized membrane protein YqaE (UPF0057 family)